MSDWFTINGYAACQTGGEADMASWYLCFWWTGVSTTESGLWSKLSLTGSRQDFGTVSSSWVCVSGQVEHLHVTYNTSGVREIFLLGLVLIKNREQLAISDDNILDHHRLCWGTRDSAMPQLAQRWQHRAAEGFGSIYTSGQITGSSQMWWFVLIPLGVFWLCSKLLSNIVTLRARAGNKCCFTLCCCSLNSSIHILTNELRAQEWGGESETKRNW